MEIRFQIVDDKLSAGLQRAVAASVDFSPAMQAIADLMELEARRRFETGTDPEGKAWLPSKRVRDGGGQTLILSGNLLSSLTRFFDSLSAEAGTNVVYAAIHQNGGRIVAKTAAALRTPFGPRKSISMPRRSFLGFGANEQARIPAILADHLRDAFEGRP